MPVKTKALLERFESKVRQVDGGCFEWQANKLPTGYGMFRIGPKQHRAHRVAYELYIGRIPKGMYVCHECDNPSCVNPGHLFLGSQKDNMQDMSQKGRGADRRGEKNGKAKLSPEDVKEIRRLVESGLVAIKVAAKFGIKRAAVSKIVLRRTWRHIA